MVKGQVRAWTGRITLGLALFVLSGCDESGTAPRVVDTVTVSPGDTTLLVGETLQLQVVARDAAGERIDGLVAMWSTQNGTVASVSAGGLLTAGATGATRITATMGGVDGAMDVVVEGEDPGPTPGPVASVTLDRVAVSLDEGDVTTLVVTARDADGTLVPGRVVQWATSNVAVAQVGFFGEVTGVKVGSAQVTARVDGATATADVSVTADYGYDLMYDISEAVEMAPVLFRLPITDADADPERVFPGRPGFDAVVSPAGDRIAFRIYADGGSQIWVANLDGSDSLKVAGEPGWNPESPSWSPDGQRIAYHAWSAAELVTQVWVVDADGTNTVKLTSDQDGGTNQWPAWSPERVGGERIAYTRIADGRAHLWTMRPDGSDKTQITVGNVADMKPAWSPEGERLAFERYGDTPGTGGDIWLVHASGASPRQLTNLPLGQFDPAWSPDGKLIAFSSGFSSQLQIYTIWTDGSKLAQRTSGERPHERPTWIMK